MAIYDLILTLSLPDPTVDPVHFTDSLFVAGCDDAVVGVGMPGSIALDFARDASTAEDAVISAINTVTKAIPGAHLVEISIGH